MSWELGAAIGGFILFLCISFFKDNPVVNRFLFAFLGVGALTFSVVTSFEILREPPVLMVDWWSLVSVWLLFLLNILAKILLIFWAVAATIGLFRPDRISEFRAKFLGFEVNHSYTRDEVIKAQNGWKQINQQMKLVSGLNEEVLEFISRPFEDELKRADDPAEEVRLAVKRVLLSAYGEHPKIRVHIVPCTPDGIKSLGDTAAALVQLELDSENDVTIIKKNFGIAIHHGEGGLSSVIVLEAFAGYQLSIAEICAASILFVAVSSVAFAQ